MINLQCYSDSIPRISVITATFNRANLLKKCIESVQNQTVRDWEHIIIDDGSEDETTDLVKSYMNKDPRIRYATHSNRKQSLSLNVGLMMAVGDYICFLDSDDHYLPNHFESKLNYLNANPNVDVIFGGMKIIGDPYVADANDPSKKIHVDDCSGTSSFFGKANIFKEVGGFIDLALGNDKDMVEKIEASKYNIKRWSIEAERTVMYVRTEDSVTKLYENTYGKNQK